jgi:hypothetical protein
MLYTDPLNSCVREVVEDARRTHLETVPQLEKLFSHYLKFEVLTKVSTLWDVTPSRLEHHTFIDSQGKFFQCTRIFIKSIVTLETIFFN